MDLNNLDLNLLRVLDTLLAERSVTRSAELLRRSQPAVSNALRRLRVLLADDLLVRGPKGLVLTPRADAIRHRCAKRFSRLKSVWATSSGSTRRWPPEPCG